MLRNKHCPSRTELAAWGRGEGRWWSRWKISRHASRCAGCSSRLAALVSTEHALRTYFEAERYSSQPTCPDLEELERYLHETLPPPQRESLCSHVTSGAGCSQLLAELQEWRAGGARSLLSDKLKGEFSVPFAVERPRRRKLVASAAVATVAVGLLTWLAPLRQLWQTLVPSDSSAVSPTLAITPARPEPGFMGSGMAGPVRVAFRYRRRGNAEIRELGPPFETTPSLSAQDDYALRITPLREGWLYVLQADSGGRWWCLFPSSRYSTGTNPVRGRQEVWIPPEGGWLYLDESAGRETIYVVHSSSPWSELEELIRRSEAGDLGTSGDFARQLREGCATEPTGSLWCSSFQFWHEAAKRPPQRSGSSNSDLWRRGG